MDSKEELLKLFNKQLIDKCKKLKIAFSRKKKNKLVDAILNHNKKQTKIKNTDTSDNDISDNDTNENSNKINETETKTESKETETNKEIENLKKVKECLEKYLTPDKLQEISNRCISVNNEFTGPGGGLTSGIIIEKVLSEYFKNILPEFECHNVGQADMKICGVKLSCKKTTGKSELALNWTKSDKLDKSNIKDPFKEHILIINLKTEQWWKRKPKNSIIKGIPNETIPMGIYLINKKFCNKEYCSNSNTKTDKLIKNQSLYNMIQDSINNKLYIKLPVSNKKLKFKINFSE